MTETAGSLTAAQVREVLLVAAVGPILLGKRTWRIDRTPIGLAVCTVGVIPRTADAERAHRIACGAVLLNLRVAVRGLGVSANVRLLPDRERPDLMGLVQSQDSNPATTSDLALSARQSSFDSGRPPVLEVAASDVGQALSRAARTEGGWLATVDPRQLRPGVGAAPTATADRLVTAIGTLDDGPLAQLRSGLSAQRVVLTAGSVGLPPVRSSSIPGGAERRRLRDVLGGALWPQVVLALDPRRS